MKLNKTVLLFFLVLPLLMPGWSKNLTYGLSPAHHVQSKAYKGRIFNITDNSPLVNVEVSPDNYGVAVYSDNDGFFEISAPANISGLNFKKEGYMDARMVFVTDADRNTFININMFPENPTEQEQELIRKNFRINSFNDLSGESLKSTESRLKSLQKTEVPMLIRVLMPDNSVVVMSMDEYLKGVVPSEVPASWNMEALKAQAVAARCYASVNFKHNSQGADVCTNTHCQVWKPVQYARTTQAVTETSNFSVRYNGSIINALFFSHCNGTTRNNENVWGGTPVPYLRSKSCPCGFTSHNAHGVGMCQYGCQAMAMKDSTWESILKWYYTGTTTDKTQIIQGTLKGVIYHGSDNSNLNNRITGATVRLHNGLEITSGEAGVYSFDLVPGQYTVTATKPGYRSASVTRDVTAGSTIWGSIEMIPAVGNRDITAAKFYVHPNPARDHLTIEVEGEVRITISNMSGKEVYEEQLMQSKTLDVGCLQRGVYIIKVSGKDYTVCEKVLLF